MCGIIGFIGKQNAVPFILSGLKNLEYRGYDSSGISLLQSQSISTIKEVGEIKNLESSIPSTFNGNIGIGHTRWATHGEINKTNAHPHLSKNNNISIVHNGIIENYVELKSELEILGYNHISSTDSEVIAHLIDFYLSKENNLLKAIFQTQQKITGSYAIAVIEKNTNSIIAIKHKSPLCVGVISNQDVMLSSDPSSIYDKTNNFIFLNDGDVIVLNKTNNKVEINLFNNEKNIPYKISKLSIEHENEDLKGYPNYMLKEIEEQPEVLNNILQSYCNIDFEKKLASIYTPNIKNIWLIACGTSYFAGELCLGLLNKYSSVNVFSCLASEFDAFSHKINKDALIITISQSGETADTTLALKEATLKGTKIISLTNATYSTIANLANLNIDIRAKKERSVASTKAFSASAEILYLVFLNFLKIRNEISLDAYNDLINDLKQVPQTASFVINNLKNTIEKTSNLLLKKDKAIFLGKYSNYVIAKEGSLKLKEITYIHSEAIPAGELKHGPLALIEKNFPIISVFNNSDAKENKIISNILETKSRGALNINITNEKTPNIENIGLNNIYINAKSDIAFSIGATIALQYLSYYTASLKNLNIDKPRNLAKSVTVE